MSVLTLEESAYVKPWREHGDPHAPAWKLVRIILRLDALAAKQRRVIHAVKCEHHHRERLMESFRRGLGLAPESAREDAKRYQEAIDDTAAAIADLEKS